MLACVADARKGRGRESLGRAQNTWREREGKGGGGRQYEVCLLVGRMVGDDKYIDLLTEHEDKPARFAAHWGK